MPRGLIGVKGFVIAEVFDEDGRLRHRSESPNIVTDYGDQLYAQRSAGIQGQQPTMMALCSFSGTPTKSSVPSGYYGSSGGDNGIRPLDAGFPTTANRGAGAGWRVTYRCTWGPTALPANNAIFLNVTAVVLCNITPVPSNTVFTQPTASQIVALDTVTTFTKGQQDTVVVTWFQDFLGGT